MIRSVTLRAVTLLRGEGPTRQLARGTLLSFFIQASGVALILFVEILLARVLGAKGYGLFAMVMAWVQVLAVVGLLGNNYLLLRFVPNYVTTAEWPLLRGLIRHSRRAGLASSAAIWLAGIAVLAALGDRVAAETRLAFLIGTAVLPLVVLSQQRQAILRGLHHVIRALSPELIVRPSLLMFLVAIFAWVLHVAVSPAVALLMNGAAVAAAFLLGRHWQRCAMPPEVRSSPPAFRSREWRRISVPLFVIAGMQLLMTRMDIMLLGSLAGHEAAGRYAAASRVADLVVFALASANVVVGPLIAGLHARGDLAGLQRMLAALAKAVLLLTLPLVPLIAFFGQSILGLFGNGYGVAYVPLLILVCGQVVNALSGPVDFVMSMTGQQVRMLQILAVATVLNFVLNLALIPAFGLVGAAFATASTTALWNLLMRRAVRMRLGVDASILVLLRGRG